jgi:uncharacterized protein
MIAGRHYGAARSAEPGLRFWRRIPGSCAGRPGVTVLLVVAIALGLAPFARALDFPALTGRVVDQAGIMSAESRSDVEAKSKELESKSGIQLVVATVASLQGSDIETFANQLFRFWKLGEAKKNNGVLFLVAPAQHKMRIEVGYGLEGTLTDALSSVIISSTIAPAFKSGDFSGGIVRGVDAIIAVLGGDAAEWQRKVPLRQDDKRGAEIFAAGFVLFVIALFVGRMIVSRKSGHYVTRHGRRVFVAAGAAGSSGWISSSSGSSSSDSSSSGSDFSGGGGSSGGGGASGDW